ncbi:type II toxin-antitoxin system VapC family toxin [Chlorogloea sp. CCALA 695]|uniref:type II toxin-antitoxin system VapC family toxin n=1 Tax=Chlorogloea sp. CCALA 695 TaxID=2107693 RepID=UPI000D056255|nr:PIN domain-containing protein [Chlorogloea sp. CCALA 695]PSB34578.1 hypothetical protein C7B70_03740 [Chlorogloea sp. CCALA 695]
MARLTDLHGCKVGLDTAVFIYALEGHVTFRTLAIKLFEQIEQGAIKASACDLGLAELMVKPLRLGQQAIAQEYAKDLPQFPNLNFCAITQAIVIAAVRLRGSSKLGLINALHLAATSADGCTVFITNDTVIQHPDSKLTILLLSDLQV